ncbi:rhomboid family intramembrane serine protease [Ancylothrix sp. C2]|uniref:rhomboid family intramembrane serine protease n=1 Tax=Ancylothrix sp. D3o TaxID=2953691 RepID=UPI0021BB0EED|nr:rhomboid family intramembrane serine protease [Ancylothrix sp. D3o]MCT7950556.1 rhomboid family intramembrane serine protease [Ancylothrix sp. D3o]
MSNGEFKTMVGEFKTQALILGGLVACFWIIEIIDIFFYRGALNSYGIIPRSPVGLRGILFAPFLHGNFLHLATNTGPFLILGWLVMLQEISYFFVVSAITILVSGLGVWLFGAPYSVHIGASGVIFGYLGFLLFRGYFQRNFSSILLSLIVAFFYGGLIWGVLPSMPRVSWEGHLFGFIGGILAARILPKRKRV